MTDSYEKSRAILAIQAERRRQVNVEGWTPEHDDTHANGELADAAACYAIVPRPLVAGTMASIFERLWPWSREWWKPADRRRNLIKAGALIVAEIERLDRAAKARGESA
jgi:hypothetical protein